jgi:cytochrome oxidase Cu insertion factor (SCO1/SenC/PrrC family)/thiol-disulfide isomerase/thioredoxin
MNKRLLLIAAVAAVVFVGTSIALRIQVAGDHTGATALPARQDLGIGVAVDRRPPPVRLLDSAGRPTTLRSFRGRWVVLAPSLTRCHEVCPMTTAALLRLRRLIAAAGGGRRFVAVEVSVDPWRDTPRRLRAYRRATGADFPLLTGSVGAVRRLMGFFGVHFERVGGDVEHTDGAFVIDPRGLERLAVPGMPAVGGRLKGPLRSLLDKQGKRNLRHPKPGWSAVALARRLEKMMGLSRPGTALAARRQGSGLVSGKGIDEGLAALSGRPAVVNVWASWCPPCREELPLFAAAERRFGSRIAFLGADLEDNAGSARSFLRRVGTDYPSYPVDEAEVAASLGPVHGAPVTFFLDRAGEVVDQHIGAYRSAAELDADLLRHAG